MDEWTSSRHNESFMTGVLSIDFKRICDSQMTRRSRISLTRRLYCIKSATLGKFSGVCFMPVSSFIKWFIDQERKFGTKQKARLFEEGVCAAEDRLMSVVTLKVHTTKIRSKFLEHTVTWSDRIAYRCIWGIFFAFLYFKIEVNYPAKDWYICRHRNAARCDCLAMFALPPLLTVDCRSLMENIRVRRAGYAFRQAYDTTLQR